MGKRFWNPLWLVLHQENKAAEEDLKMKGFAHLVETEQEAIKKGEMMRMNDNERIKKEAELYHQGRKEGAIEVLKKEINEYECVLALDTIDYAKVTNKDKKAILELIDSHKEALLALEQKEKLKAWLEKEYSDATIVVGANKNKVEYGKQIIAIMFQERREIIKKVLGGKP